MGTASNYVQFNEILANYPAIQILNDSAAQYILNQLAARYSVNNLHYFWSIDYTLPISRDRMRLRDLPSYYAKTLPKLFSGDIYLIVDCCDGRFIVCQSRVENLIQLLRTYYFELEEIYILDNTFNIRFCVNHICEVIQYN